MVVFSCEPNARQLANDDQIRELSVHHMLEISNKFGSSITKVTIWWANFISASHFTTFINAMCNLKELIIYQVGVGGRGAEWPRETLNFRNLKILRVHDVDEDFFDLLPFGVLEKVSLRGYTPSSFFMHQGNIKELRLELGSIPETYEQLGNLQLQTLSLYFDSDMYEVAEELNHVIMSQPMLLKLEIYGQINKPIVSSICTHLIQLKSLCFCFFGLEEVEGDVLSDFVSNLRKLTHLEELCLRSYYIIVTELTVVQHPQIKKLFLENVDHMHSETQFDIDDLTALRGAFPCLNELGLNNCVCTNVYELLNLFADIESLSLRMYASGCKNDLFALGSKRAHENVKRLFFGFHHSMYDPMENEFLEFFRSMPHLESLEIWNAEYFVKDTAELILNLKKSLPKLRKLNVFKTDSFGLIHHSEKGSMIPSYMCYDQHVLDDTF